MEKLQAILYLVSIIVIGCIGYSAFNLVQWVFSLFGGLCIGCP